MGALNSQSIAEYITSLEEKVEHYKERCQYHSRRNYKYRQKHERDADLKKQMRDEINQLKKVKHPRLDELEEENESLREELEKKTKTRYVYSAYIQYAGRLMKVGEYKTPEEAEEAEKRAIKAL